MLRDVTPAWIATELDCPLHQLATAAAGGSVTSQCPILPLLPPNFTPSKVIIVTGPTAVGKTAVGLELARRLNGEVISADSVQV